MKREYYLELAAAGLRLPIGIDLVLHESPDPQRVLRDGSLLAEVVASAARRYASPLAIPLMDLTLEKEDMLRLLGMRKRKPKPSISPRPRTKALCNSYVARRTLPSAPAAKPTSIRFAISPRQPILFPLEWRLGRSRS